MKLNKEVYKMKQKNEIQYTSFKYNVNFLVRQNESRLINLLTSQKKIKHDEAKTLLDDYVISRVAKQSGIESIQGGEAFEVKQIKGGE